MVLVNSGLPQAKELRKLTVIRARALKHVARSALDRKF
jgi:hypothetical protein